MRPPSTTAAPPKIGQRGGAVSIKAKSLVLDTSPLPLAVSDICMRSHPWYVAKETTRASGRSLVKEMDKGQSNAHHADTSLSCMEVAPSGVVRTEEICALPNPSLCCMELGSLPVKELLVAPRQSVPCRYFTGRNGRCLRDSAWLRRAREAGDEGLSI